jgi:hypothetical protein
VGSNLAALIKVLVVGSNLAALFKVFGRGFESGRLD